MIIPLCIEKFSMNYMTVLVIYSNTVNLPVKAKTIEKMKSVEKGIFGKRFFPSEIKFPKALENKDVDVSDFVDENSLVLIF